MYRHVCSNQESGIKKKKKKTKNQKKKQQKTTRFAVTFRQMIGRSPSGFKYLEWNSGVSHQSQPFRLFLFFSIYDDFYSFHYSRFTVFCPFPAVQRGDPVPHTWADLYFYSFFKAILSGRREGLFAKKLFPDSCLTSLCLISVRLSLLVQDVVPASWDSCKDKVSQYF